MQSDKQHLTMHSGEIKGNNSYLLNRMTVDSSFKTPQCDINSMIGYGADGKVISNKDHHNPFASRVSHSGFEDMSKASGSLISANAQRTQWSFIDKPKDLASELDEIKALTSTTVVKQHKRRKHKSKKNETVATVPDWRLAFKPSYVLDGENSLQKLTEERYNAILNG